MTTLAEEAINKEIERMTTDPETAVNNLLDYFNCAAGASFAVLVVAGAQPADAQALKRNLDNMLQANYAQAMAKVVGFEA